MQNSKKGNRQHCRLTNVPNCGSRQNKKSEISNSVSGVNSMYIDKKRTGTRDQGKEIVPLHGDLCYKLSAMSFQNMEGPVTVQWGCRGPRVNLFSAWPSDYIPPGAEMMSGSITKAVSAPAEHQKGTELIEILREKWQISQNKPKEQKRTGNSFCAVSERKP